MANTIEVCNSALVKLGASRISSLDETNKEARLCAERFPHVRDTLLRSHPWNAATRRIVLAPMLEAPAFGFTHRFQLPVDCVRILSVGDNYLPGSYKVEGKTILYSGTTLQLIYLASIDPSEMDPGLVETLSFALALELSYALRPSPELVEQLERRYRQELARAKCYDSQENPTIRVEADTWLESRIDGSPQYGGGMN